MCKNNRLMHKDGEMEICMFVIRQSYYINRKRKKKQTTIHVYSIYSKRTRIAIPILGRVMIDLLRS